MNKMEELAKRFAPVDTGRLKNSIHLTPMHSGATEYVLAAGTDYAVFVEFGTVHQRPQPYFRTAMHEVKNYWVPIFTKSVLT